VSGPATKGISDWLEKLGLGQYAHRFAENDINFSILSDLTDQDLKEIGVSSLGHRRQLLRAIAGLNGVEKGARKPDPPLHRKMRPTTTAKPLRKHWSPNRTDAVTLWL